MSIKKSIEAATLIFGAFNQHYFEGELKEPMILIQTNGRKVNAMGWCTINKIWNKQNTTEEEYEITLCGEFMGRGNYSISSTILHEMVHLYNLKHKIKDVNSNNKTHNLKFKEQAEQRGLHISKADGIGWSVSELTNESKSIIDDLNLPKDIFDWVRVKVEKPSNDKPKKETFKCICPKCNTTLTSKKNVRIVCIDCDVEFVVQQK